MSTRLGIALGLALATILSCWWLAATRIAVEAWTGAEVVSNQLLSSLVLLRAVLVALAGPRAAAVGGYVAGLRVCVPVVSVAWPLVAVAWLAGSVGLAQTLLAEVALLAGAAAAPLAGRAAARALRQGPLLESITSALGVLLALAAWQALATIGAGV